MSATATTTTKARTPHLRFALRPEKISVFFARAVKRQVPVTLYRRCGTVHADVTPLAANEKSYRVQNGKVFLVKKDEIVRIEFVY